MEVTADMLVQFLGKTEIFEGFHPEELAVFAPFLEVVRIKESHTIFQEGSDGDAWFVILDGTVSVAKEMPSGPPHVLSHLHPGESFGEMALMDGAPRMATLYAVEDTMLARLPRDTFLQLLREGAIPAVKLLWAMSTVLCQRQRELTLVLADLVEAPDDDVRDFEMLGQLLRTNVTWN
jgi:CRP/FNR family cyclic AMP-dependent transcriptional regulator